MPRASIAQQLSFIQRSNNYSTYMISFNCFALYIDKEFYINNVWFFILFFCLSIPLLQPPTSEECFLLSSVVFLPAGGLQSSHLQRVCIQISAITSAKPAKLGALALLKPSIGFNMCTQTLFHKFFFFFFPNEVFIAGFVCLQDQLGQF